MIQLYTTLGRGTLDEKFYSAFERALVPDQVQRIYIDDSTTSSNPLHSAVPWSLGLSQSQLKNTAAESECALTDSELQVWIQRWHYCTQIPIRELKPVVYRYCQYVQQQLERWQPTLVVVSSNSVPHTGIPYQLAKRHGIPVATFERGYLPKTYQIADYGSGPFSQYCNATLEELVQGHNQDRLSEIGRREAARLSATAGRRETIDVSDAPVNRLWSRPWQKRVLFLPVSDSSFSVYPVDHPDHQMILPHFRDSVDIARCLHRSWRTQTVVKPHPTEAPLPTWTEPKAEGVRIAHGDPIDWIDWADVVVCNGSTLDLVAWSRGKPVVLAGRSILSGKGIADDIDKRDDLITSVLSASKQHRTKQRMERFRLFLGWLREGHLLDPVGDRKAFAMQLKDQLSRCGVNQFGKPGRSIRRSAG